MRTILALSFLAIPLTQAAHAEPPALEPAAVFDIDPGPENPRNSEGDFITLTDGRVLFVYTHFTGGAGDAGAAHLEARVSSDSGMTWTENDTLVLENEGDQNVMSVSLIRGRDGAIQLYYLRKNSDADCRLYLRRSYDEGETWSDPQRVIEALGYFVVNNDRVLRLKSGRLIVPAARHSAPGESFNRRADAAFYLSDDDGFTWTRSDTLVQAPEDSTTGLQEPLVVELTDGRIMMLARTDQGCQMRAYSHDDGATWDEAETTGILSPVSPATAERLEATGDIVLVWNDHRDIPAALSGKRTPLRVAISRDDGASWDWLKTLEDKPDGWYCYTAMHEIDGAILLGYCAGDSAIGRLNRTRLVRIPITALYEGPIDPTP